MTILLQHLWPGLALAGLLGLGFSVVFGRGYGLPSARLEVVVGAVLLLGVGLLLSWFQTVPGRPGLWLDIAVLLCLAYAIGTALGLAICFAYRRFRPA